MKLGRIVIRFGIVVLVTLVAMYAVARALRPDVSHRAGPTTQGIADAEAGRSTAFDPHDLPSLHIDRLVTPTAQAPVLQTMVDAGELPPLRDRLPKRPTVMKTIDGVHEYGGTWLRLATGLEDVSIINNRMSSSTLLRWSPLGKPIEPHIAEKLEASPDKKQWTVTLREGLRWSDGAPYTASDIMYWWECEAGHPILTRTPPSWMIIGGKTGRIVKLDDYHVRFEFDLPYALFPEALALRSELCNTPEHYLRPLHPDPKIGNKDVIAQGMKDYALTSPAGLYRYLKTWQNPLHPRMWPWIYRTRVGNPPQIFVRNPYYYVVDEDGRQLPYVDRLQFDIQDTKILALSAANGGTSMQERNIRFADYTELMSRRGSAGTKIYHWYPATRSLFVINPNLNKRVDPNEPITKFKADLLSDKRFRQALSLALDRKRIIRAEYANIGQPSQVEPGPESPFVDPALGQAFARYDPAEADRLLDSIGLTRRDSEGYRTFADGTRMTFFLDVTTFTGAGPTQFIVNDWSKVGVRLIGRERARALFYNEKNSLEFDFNVWTGESDMVPLLKPRYFIPADEESFYAIGWGRWYARGGFYDLAPSRGVGSIAVPKTHPMYEAIRLYELALIEADEPKQIELMRQVMAIAAENVWSISIATPPPQPVVVDKDLYNVPRNALIGNVFNNPGNAGLETYSFSPSRRDVRVEADVRNALLHPVTRVGDVTRPGGGGARVAALIRWTIITIALLALLMLAFRHPFIGKRLLTMVPTMIIISLIVFTIIQLPPGDYLSQRIMYLQESGDGNPQSQIEELRTNFHFDEPNWKLYCRWTGLYWFTSFKPADTGLLQGNLGRSMEGSTPINELLGDRLVLTVALSAGTILFTWLTALPIGIYSAVRQYSVGDYILTLVGFVGMCVPAFLLALVLMAISGISGLFSPRYISQQYWDWGKFVDLLKHLWLPVVVLGIGGTAGMIRVMRANLLDELRKPYVTVARAKGVRPMKLLLKYPVRLALNPFVSGLGGLFPQLISGGAIVSLVLALPTIGPLMLQALMTEDMYLAGSMLMVLSLLGIVGTLVSDLLLLWLDPRIRLGAQ